MSNPTTNVNETSIAPSTVTVPRVSIQYCTQCKWMLRAAYFAQELLSTFSTALGEVSLIPATGGKFIVEIEWRSSASTSTSASGEDNENSPSTLQGVRTEKRLLWDRKAEGGFPEVKELKRRVRDVIEPGRDLGHVDRKKEEKVTETKKQDEKKTGLASGGGAEVAENCGPGGCD